MGKIRGGKKSSTSPLPPEKCEDACVCYRDYGLGFICIAEQKEISPSKRNRQAVDHTANLHIALSSEK